MATASALNSGVNFRRGLALLLLIRTPFQGSHTHGSVSVKAGQLHIADDALAAGRAEARAVGVTNVRFEQRDVAELVTDEPVDVVVVFDAIHDQVAPATVLRRMHDALTSGGQLFMVDINAASDIADNLEHPLAPFLYATSVLHCMTISLAHDGAGLGTVWGRQLARQMLTDAGFSDIVDRDAPSDPFNAIYTARRR
jgi:SAM-dependent methyltransferase